MQKNAAEQFILHMISTAGKRQYEWQIEQVPEQSRYCAQCEHGINQKEILVSELKAYTRVLGMQPPALDQNLA